MTGAKQVFAPRHPLSHDDPALSPDLVGPSKFAVTWPAEPSPPIQSPLPHPVERSAVLSSSEADSDLSEREFSSIDKLSQAELSDDYDTASNHRRWLQQQPGVPTTHDGGSDTTRPSRTFPAPLPSQLEHLQNHHRTRAMTPFPSPNPFDGSCVHGVSLEMADAVEMVVQTLLQISPSQILDPAKEQYAACSLPIPTSSVSAVLTTMKNLNFVSANMPELCAWRGRTIPQAENGALDSSPTTRAMSAQSDFDVGEMLQGVGDALSGCAAHKGVDLVLFHADVGLRHVAVRGEEFGLSNTLTHVIRQVLHTAYRGDAIDVELSIKSVADGSSDSPIEADTRRSQNRRGSYMSNIEDGPVRCTFQINHYFAQPETSNEPFAPTVSDPSLVRPKPDFGSSLLQRLCSRTNASFVCNLPARGSLPGRACELMFPLESGSAATINARAAPMLEYSSPLLSGARITKEPTLEELVHFSETLRGKKATLYAKESSVFAHHLTSYLTTWGMDVSHVSPGSEADGHQSVPEKVSSSDNNPTANPQFTKSRHWNSGDTTPHENSGMTSNGTSRTTSSGTFIFIDDDVSVLRERIQKNRAEQQPVVHSRGKRPSLAAHHRPKSSPQITKAMGYGGYGSPTGAQATSTHVVVYFTSLANYKIVKDIIQTDLALPMDAFIKPPLDVMIIPKPAGPRRFLTALHTAVTKPVVDPLFAPIASSPTSPGIHGPPFFGHGQTPPKSPTRPAYSPRGSSDRAVRSPREVMGEPHALHPPSPLAISDTAEYFPDGSVKLGMSPASGLVISSPDGQPAGIVFQPRAKGAKTPGVPGTIELPKAQFLIPAPDRVRRPASRRASSSEDKNPAQQTLSFSTLHTQGPCTPNRQDSLPSPDAQASGANSAIKGKRKPSVLSDDVGPPTSGSWKGSLVDTRKTSSPPGSPKASEPPTNTFTRRTSRRQDQKPLTPPAIPTKVRKGSADNNIVPPISVLIVDDNPINQTILSTFMRKKKIKYDVAKNGEEAVQKWRSGGFHLILMDIQMPVMDGIQATKEIRQLEATACTPSTPRSDPTPRTPSDAASSDSRTSTSPCRSSVIIVALTASSLQSDRVAALAAGCNDFLTKPVSLQWLNNKIIEWGSIKALQMWADLRPEAAKSISTEQNTQAQAVARRLHVPEGRATPMAHSPSRSSSIGKTEGQGEGVPLVVSSGLLPPSEKLDALLKLSESYSASSTYNGPDPANKHEGESTSSPVVEALSITDTRCKGLPDERLGSAANGTAALPETREHDETAKADVRILPGDTLLNSSGGHNAPGDAP